MTSASNFDELPPDVKAQITGRLLALLEHMATFKDQLHIAGLEAQFLTAGTRESMRDAQAAQAQAFTDLATTSATIARDLNELADINQRLIDQGYT